MFHCSPAVGEAMLRDLDRTSWRNAVELGAGDGALTSTLRSGLPADCRFFAVELSHTLVTAFRERVPGVDIAEADAGQLEQLCEERGIRKLDAIFSALPLRLLPPASMGNILNAAAKMLRPGGVFAQVTYWPAAFTPGKHMREQVVSRIGRLESDRLVAGNAPPAWIFRCIRRGGSGV
jgi:phosphatidylethanolamine/phosphatidyl-N-methylethanolamine N-methyltransferase